MEELRQAFLTDSISKLNNLRARLLDEAFSEAFWRELARALHTVKGTAQTFGFTISAALAHTAENLLVAAAQKDSRAAQDSTLLLAESLEVLVNSLADRNFQIPAALIEKIRPFEPEMEAANARENLASSGISAALIAQLSAPEKTVLNAALRGGKNLAVLEIGFAPANFAAEFKNFRDRLNESGEIIATFPSAKFAAENKIGFEIIFATYADANEAIANSNAAVSFQLFQIVTSDLPAIFAPVIIHGRNLAAELDKKIEFETDFAAHQISPATLKIVFDALLHLVRNAVDHGIAREGKIKIEFAPFKTSGVRLRISDDGRGIDLDNVRRRAVAQELISADAKLSMQETLNLIFAYGFSTRDAVSETSGRGVGLDAVKDSIEKAGGTISVKSESGKGTSFEILLSEE